MNKDFSAFEQKIGVSFKNKDLLKLAFTHRSYLNEHPHENLEHNERLEFLGDAVLELVVTEHLFAAFPDKPEGDLTAYRAALVNTGSLSQAAVELGMNDYLLLSKGEAKDTGKARQFILANTFEALVGALYLDGGYSAAQQFIASILFPRLSSIVEYHLWRDAKSHFQEKAQEVAGATPSYRVLSETGPDHDKHFTVGVYIAEDIVAEGEGKSKQEAEQNAAAKALEAKGWQ
ncbi:MAG: ribonuclease III [Parcubacteria group bacterium]|nr:ribonuclease III [Parcubacteria group bacterium]